MRALRTALVVVQSVTFPGLAFVLWRAGEPRLAVAQVLLAAVTYLVYA